MDLPQELIGEITNHRLPDDETSLRSCSLVAKPWIYPSRRRLFEIVDVTRTERLGSWLDTIPATNVGVLRHVRSLYYGIPEGLKNHHGYIDPLHEYLPSFHQLGRLILLGGRSPPLSQIGTYAAFQRTLSYLRLWCCRVTASALVTLVNYFPNLTHLDLDLVSHTVDGHLIPPFSRPLCKLSIAEIPAFGLGLIGQLMELRPQCDDVTISLHSLKCPSLVHRVIDVVGANVKRLSLEWSPEGVWNIP